MKLLKSGYETLLAHKMELLAMYILHLIYGSVIGSKLKSVMSTALENSLASEELHTGLDSDIFTDLIRHEGLDLISVMKLSMVLLPVFLLFKIFMNTGIIANISKAEYGVKNLFTNAKKYFVKNLGISLMSLVLLVLLLDYYYTYF